METELSVKCAWSSQNSLWIEGTGIIILSKRFWPGRDRGKIALLDVFKVIRIRRDDFLGH